MRSFCTTEMVSIHRMFMNVESLKCGMMEWRARCESLDVRFNTSASISQTL